MRQRSLKGLCTCKLLLSLETKLSKLLIVFRKNHSTQHCLMSMLEIWKNKLDKEGYVSAIFMDLSKAFDTLNNNLLIAKLGSYGFERDSLSFVKSYLNNRQQRVRVNNNFSSCGSFAMFNTWTAFNEHFYQRCFFCLNF